MCYLFIWKKIAIFQVVFAKFQQQIFHLQSNFKFSRSIFIVVWVLKIIIYYFSLVSWIFFPKWKSKLSFFKLVVLESASAATHPRTRSERGSHGSRTIIPEKCDTSWLTARQFFERNRSPVIRIRLFAPTKTISLQSTIRFTARVIFAKRA